MSICTICQKSYYSKSCPHCEETNWKDNLNKNNKVDGSKYNPRKIIKKEDSTKRRNKIAFNKNIALYLIAGSLIIITSVMLLKEYKSYQQEQQIARLLYGTDDYDEIEKINNKLLKQNEKMLKQFRKILLPKEELK